MSRHKGVIWNLPEGTPDGTCPYDVAQLAVLMDIRDELQRLNATLHCTQFLLIPDTLSKIERNTKPKKKAKLKLARKAA